MSSTKESEVTPPTDEAAYDQGYTAFRAGELIASNPLSAWPSVAAAWNMGWRHAEEDEEDHEAAREAGEFIED